MRRAEVLVRVLGSVLKRHNTLWLSQKYGLPVTVETILAISTEESGDRARYLDRNRISQELPELENQEQDTELDDRLLRGGLLVSVVQSAHSSPRSARPGRVFEKLHTFITDLLPVNFEALSALQGLLAIDRLPTFSAARPDVPDNRFSTPRPSFAVINIHACLAFLSNMDSVQKIAMIRIYCAYWVMGTAFETYAAQFVATHGHRSAKGPDRIRHARAQVHHLLQSLERECCVRVQLLESDGKVDLLRRKAFMQRIQRHAST